MLNFAESFKSLDNASKDSHSPFPGKLGIVEEGALADLLVVDGDPIEDISPVAIPTWNFVLIMKDRKMCKDIIR